MAVRRDPGVRYRVQLHAMPPLWCAVGLRLRGRTHQCLRPDPCLRSRKVDRVSFLPRVWLCGLLAIVEAGGIWAPAHRSQRPADGTPTRSADSHRSFRWAREFQRPATRWAMRRGLLVLRTLAPARQRAGSSKRGTGNGRYSTPQPVGHLNSDGARQRQQRLLYEEGEPPASGRPQVDRLGNTEWFAASHRVSSP
jgi:hypothetical protein